MWASWKSNHQDQSTWVCIMESQNKTWVFHNIRFWSKYWKLSSINDAMRHHLWIAYNSSHVYQRTLNLPLQTFGGREGSKQNFKIWPNNNVCLAWILKNVALVFLKVSLSTKLILSASHLQVQNPIHMLTFMLMLFWKYWTIIRLA